MSLLLLCVAYSAAARWGGCHETSARLLSDGGRAGGRVDIGYSIESNAIYNSSDTLYYSLEYCTLELLIDQARDMSASAGPGANSPPVLRPSMTASSGLMSTVRPDLRAAPVRRGGQSTNTQFPFDVPVIKWKSKFQDAEMEQVRLQTVICHSGWLFKRAQVTLDSKRWFVLENNRLYSYMRQDYLKVDGPSDEYTMFPPSIRAVIDLEHCQIKVITKQKMLLEIECKERACWSKKGNLLGDLGTGLSTSPKTFTFYAEDDTSFQSWVDALARVEAYKKLKCQVPVRFQPPPEPLTFWDLPRESLLRIFCRMPDDKPEFKFFEKKWPALREEDVMFYRRVVLLLNGSHQRAMDRHKQVALQEWEVNNSWKEVFEHITLNKLTSEPVIEVEYPKLELKLPLENSKLAIKVKERMEIFADYKALPRILMRSLKELQELKIEQIMAAKFSLENHPPLDTKLDIEIWLLQVDPFVAKFQATQASALKDQKTRGRSAHHSPVVVETEEDVQFATQHLLHAVDIADFLLTHLGSMLMLEDGPVCEKGIIRSIYNQVMILIPTHKDVDTRNKEAAQDRDAVDVDKTDVRSSVQLIDELDDNGNPIQLSRKASKDPAHAPELFSDWEGGAAAMEPLSYVTFFTKIHGLIKALLKNETDLQSYFGRICENLLKKDKPSDDAKGFRASTMKKEADVQHLPVNGHVQTVAFRSLKSKSGEAARTDAIVQKISSFITVGSFSAHSLKFKHCRGYDGELLKLAKLLQSFDANLAEIFETSDYWLKAVQGDETSITELDKKPLDEVESSVSMSHGVATGSQHKLQKQYDQLVSRIWKIFIPGPKSDISIPSIVKARSDGVIRRSMSISQALSAFAEVIMSQIKTFYHGSCPDFWYILDLVGAFTLTVSCLVSVFHDEMGMLDDTYNACRWVIDRRLMIRLALMPVNLSSEQDSDFFWTLCEDSDTGPKSSRSDPEIASAYNILFRKFPCEGKRKKDDPSSICHCQVCNSHPLPIWDEKRSDEEFPAYFHNYRSKAAPSDFMQPVLVIYVRKKYWDKIPSFVKDQSSGSDPEHPTHLRYDYPLFPIFNNVGINENQRRAASMNPTNFLMQNRVNADAGAVFSVCLVFYLVFIDDSHIFSEYYRRGRNQFPGTFSEFCDASSARFECRWPGSCISFSAIIFFFPVSIFSIF